MRDTFLRLLTDKEKNILHRLMVEDEESGYRARIILLKDDDGYTHSTTDKKNNQSSYDNIRKWIHRFEKGIDGVSHQKSTITKAVQV